MILTPEEAWELLCEYNQGEFHRKHGRIVGDVLRWYANELGYGDEADFWEAVGILHDLDFEQWPEQHCTKEQELLRQRNIYVRGAIVPLVFGAVPFFTRQVESALAELDSGLIEAALSMGSSPVEIIFRVYLKESVAAIARGTTITAISLLNLTAMAGVVGAGGLGDFAIRYGHDRNMVDVTNVTVLVLVIIVCIMEFVGGQVVKKNTH